MGLTQDPLQRSWHHQTIWRSLQTPPLAQVKKAFSNANMMDIRVQCPRLVRDDQLTDVEGWE